MTVAGRKVLLLAASEFEDMELLYLSLIHI